MSDISKNIVIAGGGATGWLSALILKNNFPEHNISIIKVNKYINELILCIIEIR
jgi:NADH dehydrogenase FAD-containing subunit